jgi:hypothetical protein
VLGTSGLGGAKGRWVRRVASDDVDLLADSDGVDVRDEHDGNVGFHELVDDGRHARVHADDEAVAAVGKVASHLKDPPYSCRGRGAVARANVAPTNGMVVSMTAEATKRPEGFFGVTSP